MIGPAAVRFGFRALPGDLLGRAIERADRFVEQPRPAGRDFVAAIGDDEQATVPELPLEAPRVVDRHERIPIADRNQAGAVMRRRSRGVMSGCTATSAAIAGSSRRHVPRPWTGS